MLLQFGVEEGLFLLQGQLWVYECLVELGFFVEDAFEAFEALRVADNGLFRCDLAEHHDMPVLVVLLILVSKQMEVTAILGLVLLVVAFGGERETEVVAVEELGQRSAFDLFGLVGEGVVEDVLEILGVGGVAW